MIFKPEDLLTRQEAADLFRVHVSTIDRAVARRDLIPGGTPGRPRFEREELDRWFHARQNGRDSG